MVVVKISCPEWWIEIVNWCKLWQNIECDGHQFYNIWLLKLNWDYLMLSIWDQIIEFGKMTVLPKLKLRADHWSWIWYMSVNLGMDSCLYIYTFRFLCHFARRHPGIMATHLQARLYIFGDHFCHTESCYEISKYSDVLSIWHRSVISVHTTSATNSQIDEDIRNSVT